MRRCTASQLTNPSPPLSPTLRGGVIPTPKDEGQAQATAREYVWTYVEENGGKMGEKVIDGEWRKLGEDNGISDKTWLRCRKNNGGMQSDVHHTYTLHR